MASSTFKKTLGRGIALAIPVAVVIYVFIRIIKLFEKAIAPVAHKMGVDHIWGQLTLTIFAVILIIILMLLLGLLMRLAVVAAMRSQLESVVLKFIPSLNQLKVMAADKLELETMQDAWKPVLVYLENKYNAAFIVEESGELVTLFVCKGTSLSEGEIATVLKEEVKLIPVDYTNLHKYSKAFGKGYISLIKN